MNLAISVNQKQLMDVLLDVAPLRPVFIWGAPGTGKSSIVEQFAAAVGLPCVSLLGSQLAPEDIIGVPRIVEGRSEFCPPRSIAREVKRVRVVFCDAAPYDQGFLDPADIAGAVEVRGRGGTRLQRGIDLLEEAPDFPGDAPLLIITDGYCDRLNLRGREHAYLVPWGNRLPFPAKGPVFKLK